MLCFWYRLNVLGFSNSSKLSAMFLKLCSLLYEKTAIKLNWLNGVYTLLNDLGLQHFWLQRDNVSYSINYFKSLVKQGLKDHFLQKWLQNVQENNVCLSYRLFKDRFGFEGYLTKLSFSARRSICRFRLSNHRLPIQQQRQLGIPREERVCHLCDKNEIGDEFHYLFNCAHPVLTESRKVKLTKYFHHHPNVIKMNQLLNSTSRKRLRDLADHIRLILSLF